MLCGFNACLRGLDGCAGGFDRFLGGLDFLDRRVDFEGLVSRLEDECFHVHCRLRILYCPSRASSVCNWKRRAL
ncbi:hypothetical protein D3C71_1782270 [compost metagenome]